MSLINLRNLLSQPPSQLLIVYLKVISSTSISIERSKCVPIMSKTGEVCTNQREHGVDIEWTINDFSSLSEKDGVGYWSPLFSFDDYSWFLGIYPNGARSTDSIGHIDLYLELNKKISDHPIRVDFSIALKTANGQKDQERHFTKDFNGRNRHDFLRFITRSDLSMRESELISSGVLTVVCTMKRIRQTMCKSSGSASNTATSDCCYCNVIFDAEYISSHQKKCMDRPIKCPDCFEVVKLRKWLDDHECQNERTEDEACTSESCINLHEKRVLHDLKELFLKKEYCDVVVKVKGREFLAHRNILKARSPVFASIFEHDIVENAIGTVEIDDCDPSSFSDFLCFLYCGEVGMISHENVFSLFNTANKYEALDLRAKCIEFMKKNLSVDTFCGTIILALRHSETDLLKLTTDYFTKNAPKIIITPEWQSFLAENPTESNELLVKLLANKQRSSNPHVAKTSSKKPDNSTCSVF